MNERQWYEIRAQAGAAEVYIYEQIGEDLFGEGVSAKNFCAELAALDVASIALHVNSPGGSVFDGQAIYNAVRRHPAAGHQLRRRRRRLDSQRGRPGRRPRRDGAQRPVHDPRPLRPARAAPPSEHRKMADVLDQVAGTITRRLPREDRPPGRGDRPGDGRRDLVHAPRRRSSSASSTRSPSRCASPPASTSPASATAARRRRPIDALPPAEDRRRRPASPRPGHQDAAPRSPPQRRAQPRRPQRPGPAGGSCSPATGS